MALLLTQCKNTKEKVYHAIGIIEKVKKQTMAQDVWVYKWNIEQTILQTLEFTPTEKCRCACANALQKQMNKVTFY